MRMPKKIPRDFRPIAKRALAAGWTITPTNGGHYRWTAPDGAFFYTAASPSDRRAPKNVKRNFEKLNQVA